MQRALSCLRKVYIFALWQRCPCGMSDMPAALMKRGYAFHILRLMSHPYAFGVEDDIS